MDFIGKRRIWFTFSITMIIISICGMAFNWTTKGRIMNFGIDFTGGTLLVVRFQADVQTGAVRDVLTKYGLAESVVQKFGDKDVSIKMGVIEDEKRRVILADLNSKLGGAELLEADMIGPVIGKELRTQAMWALIVASILMAIYMAFRFEFKYSIAAILALYHDAIITTGLMAIMWREIDVTFVAAILTILGYSINDTVVIFDRVREDIRRAGTKKVDFADILNHALNSTMARSINTVLTVLVMVIMLFVFGGATIKEFSLTLLIGFSIGTYSSVFVAPEIVYIWKKWEEKRK